MGPVNSRPRPVQHRGPGTEPRPCMVLRLKPMGKLTTKNYYYKFWTEPRLCMVLELKPMGKPTKKENYYKFWTEPRPCMVLGLKPMGKPTKKENYHKFWTEPRPCMVLGLKPMGKPSTKKKIITSLGQNQGLVWSSDSSLWEKPTTWIRKGLNFVRWAT